MDDKVREWIARREAFGRRKPSHLGSTQKAVGLYNLVCSGHVPAYSVWPYAQFVEGKFCRPCPMKPRHGFVDSRVVHTRKDFDCMLEEIYGTGELEAEVIMMPYVEASYSGIAESNRIAFGFGNDGVTGGKDNYILHMRRCIDASSQDSKPYQLEFVHASNVQGEKESRYVIPDATYWVQRRETGGKPIGEDDIIHAPVMVSSITVCTRHISLLAWEKTVRKLAKERGAVVYAPGMNTIGHHAMHCNILHVPFITSHAPYIGELIEPTEAERRPHNVQKIAYYAYKILGAKGIIRKPQAGAIVASIHTQLDYEDSNFESFVAALGIVGLLKLAIAACYGEARHCKDLDSLEESTYIPNMGGSNRNNIYNITFMLGYDTMNVDFRALYNIFKYGKFNSKQYGGAKWAARVNSTAELCRRLSTFIRYPTLQRYKALVLHCNKLVTAAHNCGRFLNKFISSGTFINASQNPGYLLADIGNAMWELFHKPVDRWVKLDKVKMSYRELTKEDFMAKLVGIDTLRGQVRIYPDNFHIQFKLPGAVNRFYGAAIDIANLDGVALNTGNHKPVQSLATTKKEYYPVAVTVDFSHSKIKLTVGENEGTWLDLTERNKLQLFAIAVAL